MANNIIKLNYTADEINEKLGKVADVVQSTGDSETKVMSQKATTEELSKKTSVSFKEASGNPILCHSRSHLKANITNAGTFVVHGCKNLLNPLIEESTNKYFRSFGKYAPSTTIYSAGIYAGTTLMNVVLPKGTYTFSFDSDSIPTSKVYLEYESGDSVLMMKNGETLTFENDVIVRSIKLDSPHEFAEGEYLYEAQLEYGSVNTVYEKPSNAPQKYEYTEPMSIDLFDGTNLFISDENMSIKYETAVDINDTDEGKETVWSGYNSSQKIKSICDHRYIQIAQGKNLFNKSKITDGVYLNNDGQFDINHEYFTSDYIVVSEGEKYTISNVSSSIISLVFYRGLKKYHSIIPITTLSSNTITIPERAEYLRFSAPKHAIEKIQLEKGETATSYEPYTDFEELSKIKAEIKELSQFDTVLEGRVSSLEAKDVLPQPFELFAEQLTSDTPMSILVPCTKYDNAIGFDADITSFSDLTIAHGKTNPWGAGYAVIDNTNVTVYKFGDAPSIVSTHAHGLTISDHITVSISVSATERMAIVSLATPSGVFATPPCQWDASHRTISAEVSSGILTNATIRYGCNSANNDIWAFGDSFFDYWPTRVYEMGFTKWMVDSYSGRKSNEGYNAFKRSLQVHIPKMVIWCMGMNDYDNSDYSAGAVNTDWKEYVEQLIDDCNANNIELILCTIPNTPIRNHTYKNEYIKASGLRYIDLDRAVGGSSDGWYSGLLSTDNVHPSDSGAKYIANVMLSTIPELCKK